MRIATFSLAYPPFVGGAEIAVKEITSRLPDFHFEILTHDFPKYGHGKLAKFLYILRAWRKAEKLHKEKPFQGIWAIMAAYAGLAALLFKLRHPSIPFLLTLQEGDSEEHILKRVGIFRPIWRMIFKKADRIQAISNYLADFARRHGANCPVEVVPNGVALEQFGARNDRGDRNGQFDQAERSIKRSDRAPIIITTSRLVHKNGIDILIDAVKSLKIPVKLEIVGDGPQRQELELRAKNPPRGVEINFRGHVDPGLIGEYLAKADIFVRPSRSEGLGNSFLEAMAAGLPIIGTPVGGITDFLKDGETGLFYKVENPQDLAEKMTLLLQDDRLRKRLIENGKKLVSEKYSWDSIASKMRDVFKSLEIRNLPAGRQGSKLEIVRLLIATGIYPPDIGGPATYTVLLEKELPKRGISVGVLPFTNFRKKPKIIRHLLYFWDCWKAASNADFVYAQDSVSVGLPSLLAAKFRKKKFFIRVAGDYAWEQAVQRFGVKDGIDDFQNKKYDWRTELLRKIQKWVVGNADLVITPSRYFQKLVGGWIKTPDKVHVIYNGIKLDNTNTRMHTNDTNRKTIISAGRLVPWKGFDVLIETMKDLPDWKLVVVGDGPERENLELRIKNYELKDRIRLVGSVSRGELLQLLQSGSVFVLNTSFESFSFQTVEAMAAGLPVIATNIGNLAEIIENGEDGLLVEPNNKQQMLSAIKKIDTNYAFREKIIKNAKEKAKQFSISRTVDNLVDLLNEHTG